MLYEGFAPDIYWWLEGLGFCPVGTAWQWIQDGRIGLGGELPVNTFGGSCSGGRLHGISHWVEAVKQVVEVALCQDVVLHSVVRVARTAPETCANIGTPDARSTASRYDANVG